jgi:hypothetical protein
VKKKDLVLSLPNQRSRSGEEEDLMAIPSITSTNGMVAKQKNQIPAACVRYSGVAHFDHLIWPTWVVILCIIRPGFGLTGCETYSCPP